jgi:membrane-associated phospholipid phosphatase
MGTGDFFFQNDLFFSGHTGGPFLVALILWKNRFMRYSLLIVSVLMAFTVLAMRLHYSIDIIGAYFITYGIFKMTENLVHKTGVFLYSDHK